MVYYTPSVRRVQFLIETMIRWKTYAVYTRPSAYHFS